MEKEIGLRIGKDKFKLDLFQLLLLTESIKEELGAEFELPQEVLELSKRGGAY